MLRNFLKYQWPGQLGEVDRPTNTRWLVVAFAVSLAVLPIGYRGTQPALPEILAAHAVVGLAKARSGLGRRRQHSEKKG